ncbi:hypothetical protein [Amycolatopsis sp. lyj-23]|uniref:hypothetical protein n=1 Tax=Amycolatopsis sp. lyj-23 TaxID=2789283 RepID=UPI0039784AA4
MTDETTAEIEVLLASVDEAAERVKTAKADLATAKGQFDSFMAELGRRRVQTGENQLSQEFANRIYWDHPDVSVSAIGLGLGIAASAVSSHVGNKTYEATCPDCSETVLSVQTSRTGYKNPYVRCDRCKAVEADRQAEWERSRPEREAETAARKEAHSQRLREGDYWISVDEIVFLPEASLRDDYFAVVGSGGDCVHEARRIADERAWKTGKGVKYICIHCGRVEEPTLVRYVERSRGETP